MSDFTVAAIATVGIVLAGKYQFLIGNVRRKKKFLQPASEGINSS